MSRRILPIRHILFPVVVGLAVGAVISVGTALVAAALRPADGWPNILGAGPAQSRGVLPQFRVRTGQGDVVVFIHGGPVYTSVTLTPLWVEDAIMDDEQRAAGEEYWPYPENIRPDVLALFGHPTRFEIPLWATRWSEPSKEEQIITTAWGWPWRCLAGTERKFLVWKSDGASQGTRSEFSGYWLHGSGPAGTRLRQLPLRVIPAGLAADALAVGTAAGIVVVLGKATLRRVRAGIHRRHGRCPACGYERQGLTLGALCPECGARAPAATTGDEVLHDSATHERAPSSRG